MSRSTIGLVGAVCGGLFIGYCIYFDRKRRSDPDYKKKVLERRRRQEEEAENSSKIVIDFNDRDAINKLFMQELELGEDLLRTGEIEASVEHFCIAIAICPAPEQMLSTLQQTLPPQVFLLLLQKIPEVSRRIQKPREPTIRVARPNRQMEDNLELE